MIIYDKINLELSNYLPVFLLDNTEEMTLSLNITKVSFSSESGEACEGEGYAIFIVFALTISLNTYP